MSALGQRVLVIEDEVLIRMLAVDMLEEIGHDVVEAGTGAEALEKLRGPGSSFTVVFLDIGLPDMHGDDLIAEIRNSHPSMPLLVASGEDQAELSRRLGDFEPIFFLGKPYDIGRLQEALAAVQQKTG